MECLGSRVLTDPDYRMPAVERVRQRWRGCEATVVRFSDGDCHMGRRGLTEEIVHEVRQVTFVVSPTASLLRAIGMPEELADDVARVAASYQPHSSQSSEADAATDRLVDACGGRDEDPTARVCVLVEGYAATEALIARRREGSDDPPAPTTRRVREDGTLDEVDLTDAHFGRGPHRCPADELARRLAEEALS